MSLSNQLPVQRVRRSHSSSIAASTPASVTAAGAVGSSQATGINAERIVSNSTTVSTSATSVSSSASASVLEGETTIQSVVQVLSVDR